MITIYTSKMGSGKTLDIINKSIKNDKTIILCPKILIINDIFDRIINIDKNAKIYKVYKNAENDIDINDANIILSTFKSFPKLLKNINIYNYNIIIDECHEIYKGDGFIIWFLERYQNVLNIEIYTASYFILLKIFNLFNICYKVKKIDCSYKSVNITKINIISLDDEVSFKDSIRYFYDKDNLVFFYNKKNIKYDDDIINSFYILNSDNKSIINKLFKNIDKLRLISTEVISSGINIDCSNIDKLHIVAPFYNNTIDDILQFAGRFRNTNIELNILFKRKNIINISKFLRLYGKFPLINHKKYPFLINRYIMLKFINDYNDLILNNNDILLYHINTYNLNSAIEFKRMTKNDIKNKFEKIDKIDIEVENDNEYEENAKYSSFNYLYKEIKKILMKGFIGGYIYKDNIYIYYDKEIIYKNKNIESKRYTILMSILLSFFNLKLNKQHYNNTTIKAKLIKNIDGLNRKYIDYKSPNIQLFYGKINEDNFNKIKYIINRSVEIYKITDDLYVFSIYKNIIKNKVDIIDIDYNELYEYIKNHL